MKSIRIILLMAALPLAEPGIAQIKGTSFIGISGGISLPMGNWGKSSTASSLMSINGTINDVHGYAKLGGFGAVDGAWFFNDHFAIGAMFKYGTHGLKGIDSLSQGYEESFDVDTTRTTHTSYKLWSFMPGLYYTVALTPKISLRARVMAGIAGVSTPQITVTIEDGGVFDPPVIQYAANKIAAAFDGGLGLSYALEKSLAINLLVDYFYTKPDFTISNTHRNTNAGRQVNQYDQALTSLNVSVGASYRFGKK